VDAISSAPRPGRSVVNVGAGAGSYEPHGLPVIAVEPSAEMVAQRPAGSAPVVRAVAEQLPIADGAFGVALAVLTVHHWTDLAAGCAELRRVAARVVVLTFEPIASHDFWLLDYIPEIGPLDSSAPSVAEVIEALGDVEAVETVPVPHDCRDGFLGAFWRRPDRYLDPATRAGISGLARLDPLVVERGIDRLRADLESGAWSERHADLLDRDEIDLGYRLLVG